MEDLLDLLEEAREQLMEMWKVADDSVADYIISIEIAVNFIDKAIRTQDRLDIFKALQKAYDTLEKEYQETPTDEEYDDLVDRLRNVLEGINEVKRNLVKKIITETVLEFLNEDVVAYQIAMEYQLTEQQKTDIKKIVEETKKRNGFMAFTYGGDHQMDTAYIGARIDPMNSKNWIRSKEEVLYRVPYKLVEALHTYAKELLKANE